MNEQQGQIKKLPPKRFRKKDLGTDRAREYNRIHSTSIANNAMLDRYLTNKEQLDRMENKRG